MRRFKDDPHDGEMLARTWAALEKRGRNPKLTLRCDRPPEELLEKARRQIDALDKAKQEQLPPDVKVLAVSDLEHKVMLQGQYCGRVEMDGQTRNWLSVDRDFRVKAWNSRQDAVDYLTLYAQAERTERRRRKLLG